MRKIQEEGPEKPLPYGHISDTVLGQEGSHSSTAEQRCPRDFIQLHSMENDTVGNLATRNKESLLRKYLENK